MKHSERTKVGGSSSVPGEGARRKWTAPELRRMRAGDAENGFTNTVTDIGITKS
jgi:hypothetical protein